LYFGSNNYAQALIDLMRQKRDPDLLKEVDVVPLEKDIYTPPKYSSIVKVSSPTYSTRPI